VTGFVRMNIQFWRGKLKVRRNVEYMAIHGRLTQTCIINKRKVKVVPLHAMEACGRMVMCVVPLILISGLDRGEYLYLAPAAYTPERTQYSWNRRLGGPNVNLGALKNREICCDLSSFTTLRSVEW
jgi:hypothetical protein